MNFNGTGKLRTVSIHMFREKKAKTSGRPQKKMCEKKSQENQRILEKKHELLGTRYTTNDVINEQEPNDTA